MDWISNVLEGACRVNPEGHWSETLFKVLLVGWVMSNPSLRGGSTQTKMACEGFQHRTIKSYMAGVRHLHIEDGMGDPLFMSSLPRLHYVMRRCIKGKPARVAGRDTQSPQTTLEDQISVGSAITGSIHCHAVNSMLPGFLRFSEGQGADYAR